MAWQQTPYSVALVIATLATSLLAFVAWQYRDHTGARPLAALLGATAWWSGTYLLTLSNTAVAVKLLAHKLMYPAIVLVPVAWLWFAIDYTGRFRKPAPRDLGLLLVIPILTVAFTWTNPRHGLIWSSVEVMTRDSAVLLQTTKGLWFWVFVAYTYVLLGLGTVLILRMVFLADDFYRGQAIALVIAVIIPWGANTMYLTGLSGVWDLTNLGFVGSGMALTVAVFRQELLQIVPAAREVARDEVIDSMTEAVIVIDDHSQIIDLNPAAEDLIDDPKATVIGQPIDAVLPSVSEMIEQDPANPTQAEISLDEAGARRYYTVRMTELKRAYGTITGQLLTIRDVTQRKEREQQIESHRQRLQVANRVFRHDIRNRINVIRGSAELLLDGASERDRVRKIIRVADEITELSEKAQRLEEVGVFEGATMKRLDVVQVVEEIVREFERRYSKATVRTTLPEEAWVYSTASIDVAIRNVIENAIRHNDRSNPLVELSVLHHGETDGTVWIRVADDGPGLPEQERTVIESGDESPLEHTSGIGLWLVYWIVTECGADVEFADNDPRGTIVTLKLPAAGSVQADTHATGAEGVVTPATESSE